MNGTNITTAHGGQLMLHCGAASVDRALVAAAPLPPATESFKPLPHLTFLDALSDALATRQVSVVREHLALKAGGMQLFGIWDVSTVAPSGDFRSVLGFRNSNDRSWAAGIVSGSRVFVCDNLAFSGEFVCLNKKHTSGLDIDAEIPAALDRWEDNFQLLCGLSDHLKDTALSPTTAKALMVDLVRGGFPARLLPELLDGYWAGRNERMASGWDLFNAATGAARQMRGIVANQRVLLGITRTLRAGTGYRVAQPADVDVEDA